MRDHCERVERDPDDDRERLPDDVLRRAEEARRALRPPAERVLTEGAVVLGLDCDPTSVGARADGGTRA
jgi:hypothetical protein